MKNVDDVILSFVIDALLHIKMELDAKKTENAKGSLHSLMRKIERLRDG